MGEEVRKGMRGFPYSDSGQSGRSRGLEARTPTWPTSPSLPENPKSAQRVAGPLACVPSGVNVNLSLRGLPKEREGASLPRTLERGDVAPAPKERLPAYDRRPELIRFLIDASHRCQAGLQV